MRIVVILAACGSQPPPPVASPPAAPIAIDAAAIDPGIYGSDPTNGVEANKIDPGIHGSDPTNGVTIDPGSHVPTVRQVTPQGALDKVAIRTGIKQHIHQIQLCYEKANKLDMSMAIMTQFTIGKDGTVTSSTATVTGGGDQEVANCVAAVIKGIVFPAPEGGGSVNVDYPFNFRGAS